MVENIARDLRIEQQTSSTKMSLLPKPSPRVSRVELPAVATFGWQVRMQRNGQKISRFFSDRTYGNAEESYHAARSWRDNTLAEWNAISQARTCNRSSRNISGVVGVSRIRVRASNGTEYEFWQATWCPIPGIRKTARFSILRHGDAVAYQLAIEARQRGVE